MKRLHARVDANQEAIVLALRAMGCSVQTLAPLGCGVPDLLVGRNGVNILMEIKDGAQPPSGKALTPDEKRWHKSWRGGKVRVVESTEGAVLAVLEEGNAGQQPRP